MVSFEQFGQKNEIKHGFLVTPLKKILQKTQEPPSISNFCVALES
jgi:hypothetical protein